MSLAQALPEADDMPAIARYRRPTTSREMTLRELLAASGRDPLEDRQMDFLRRSKADDRDVPVFLAGDVGLLNRKCVSIVGTREVSEEGWRRASKLARELADLDVVVVSGLARGVDTAALSSALRGGGSVAAVIGTPLEKAYPAENAALQERIWRDNLLVSPFASGERVFRSNFPMRNRVMAALSDATVIVEASDTSGTLHQAAECQKLGRWLFIMSSVANNRSLSWPSSFLGKPKTAVLSDTSEIIARIA